MSSTSSTSSTSSNENIPTSKTIEYTKETKNASKLTIKDIKTSKFNELIQWIQKWGFKVTDKSTIVNIPGIELQAEIIPQLPYPSGLSTPIFLEFQDDLDDGFIIRTLFELDKNIEIYLKSQNRAREIELAYIEINQIILPLKVSIIRDHPFLKLYKIMFYSDLKKQEFLDGITELI